MKTPEDEAFDDLARRQGMWGGGFQAKRQMAADKLWDRPSVAFDEWWNGDNDESTNPFRLESGAYWAWAGWKAALAQPVQQEEDWGALAEKQLASIKRDTRASFEDAMVRATHKVMAKFEEPAHCQCPACKDGVLHASDCAVHTGPAYSLGPCDCGVAQEPVAWGFRSADGAIYDCISPKAHDECEGSYNVPLYTKPPEPAQEPEMLTIAYQSGYYDGKKAALAGREWNFCERCGKRTADLTVIHTCTPPQDGA